MVGEGLGILTETEVSGIKYLGVEKRKVLNSTIIY